MAVKSKSPTIQVDGQAFLRIPIRTHVVMPSDDIVAVVKQYAGELGISQMHVSRLERRALERLKALLS